MHCLGDSKGFTLQRANRDLGTTFARYGNSMLDVNDTDDVIGVLIDHRESRIPRFACESNDVGGGISHSNRGDTRARGHDVLGLVIGERQRFTQEGGGVFLHGPVHRTMADGRREFFRGSRRRQFFFRFDAERSNNEV